MSAPPTSSVIPEHLRQPAPLTPAHQGGGGFHLPKLRLEMRDLDNKGTLRALAAINFGECVRSCAHNVLRLLYQHPSRAPCPLPTTRSVTLIVRDMDGVAYTTGSELDGDHKEIHLSTRHIDNQSPERICDELYGVITHELVHCFQYDGQHTCKGGLIEGIADWVRLRCGHVPPHWKPRAEGCGWDAGYETTGYFLDYLERQCGEGTVRRINSKLQSERYEEEKFWPDLFGSTIEELWETYAASLN